MGPQRVLLIDLFQIALDLAGIVDPSGVADASSGAISLLRGRFFDAAVSAASIVPYVGDTAKLGKVATYAKTVRTACRLGLEDIKFGRRLKTPLEELQKLLQKARLIKLPPALRLKLVEMEQEIAKFLQQFERVVLARVKIPQLNPAGLIAGEKFSAFTQHRIRNELARSGLREAHNGHFITQLIERGPQRGIANLKTFASEFNRGVRQLGKEEGTIEVLLLGSEAKVVLNFDGELITFVIGEISKLRR